MKKRKITVIIALLLILAGIAMVFGTFAVTKFNPSAFSVETFTEKEYTPAGAFSDVNITASSSEVTLLPTDSPSVKILCNESDKMTYAVTVDNGILSITETNTGKWYERIGIFSDKAKVCVYLPETTYKSLTVQTASGEVKIAGNVAFEKAYITTSSGEAELLDCFVEEITIMTSSGDTEIEKVTANTVKVTSASGKISICALKEKAKLSLESTSGKIDIDRTESNGVTAKTVSGDFEAESLIVYGKMHISTSSGSVGFDACDADELEIETVSGGVGGSLLTNKIFSVKTVSGTVKVPETYSGGVCKVKTTSGNVRFRIGA